MMINQQALTEEELQGIKDRAKEQRGYDEHRQQYRKFAAAQEEEYHKALEAARHTGSS